MKRLLVAGGGTGGHVYPLLAVLEALPPDRQVEVCYLGRGDSIEERLARSKGLEFYAIPAGGVRSMGLRRAVANLVRLAVGFGRALGQVRRFQPDVALVTGGYVSVPAALAAWLNRRPVVVCLPDMEPGLAVRALSRLAAAVTVTCEEVSGRLPAGKAVVTGYPVRAALVQGDRGKARARLGLAADEPVVLIFGGSSGARAINEATLGALDGLLQLAKVYHITGPLDYERVQAVWKGLGTCARTRYMIYSYVEEMMPDLLWAADLVVARAGAATLGEFPVVGVPAVLVPGSFGGGHQEPNASYMRDRGAAVIIEDAELPQRLSTTVQQLMEDGERRARMAAASRALARPQAAAAIVTELQRAADRRPR